MSKSRYASAVYLAIAGWGVALPSIGAAKSAVPAESAETMNVNAGSIVALTGSQLGEQAKLGLEGELIAGLLTCSSNCNNNNHNNNNNNNNNNNGGGGRLQADDPELLGADEEEEYLV